MISARTKAALAAAKARGVRLGNPHLLARCPVLAARARDAHQAEARRRTAIVLPYLEQARLAGATTLWQLADALMKRGGPAPRGGQRWYPAQARRMLGAAKKKKGHWCKCARVASAALKLEAADSPCCCRAVSSAHAIDHLLT